MSQKRFYEASPQKRFKNWINNIWSRFALAQEIEHPPWCEYCKKYIGDAKICPYCNQAQNKKYPIYKDPEIPQYRRTVPSREKTTEDKIATIIMILYRIFFTIIFIGIAIAIAITIYNYSDVILNYILVISIVGSIISVFLIKFVIEDLRM